LSSFPSKGGTNGAERGIDRADRIQPLLSIHQLDRIETAFNVLGGLVETELESAERQDDGGTARVFFHEPKELPMGSYEESARRRHSQEVVKNSENLMDGEAELRDAIEDVEAEGVNDSSTFGIIRREVLHADSE
jgi:hypothetical protein